MQKHWRARDEISEPIIKVLENGGRFETGAPKSFCGDFVRKRKNARVIYMKYTLTSLEELKSFAEKVLAENPARKVGARVLALSGNLGAGKTAFTKMLAGILGVPGEITSPTFVIMKRYSLLDISHAGFKNLIHIDAYRLESGNELLKLGFQNMLADKENLIVIEWPERVPLVIPLDATRLAFHVVNETTREVEYSGRIGE